jgi:hypothetical protein
MHLSLKKDAPIPRTAQTIGQTLAVPSERVIVASYSDLLSRNHANELLKLGVAIGQL